MIANNSAKNTGATRANSTAAEPFRLRRNRRKTFLAEADETADGGIGKSWRRRQRSTRKEYLKVIVELFRRIEAVQTAKLAAS
jgi:hypothetical protein